MGKRSSFERNPRDFYPTPKEAVTSLIPHLRESGITYFAEPCCGNLDLINHLDDYGYFCTYYSDIERGNDALELKGLSDDTQIIITNPPWDRNILHPMIEVFRNLRSTWLLIDADWMHTRQSSEYMKYCHKIVSIGRLKWIPDSKMTGKDNCCWYLFDRYSAPTTRFYGR